MPPSQNDSPRLSRETLTECTERVIHPGAGAKPAVLVVRVDGRLAVVKDFSRAPWLIRHTYGRWLVGRESRIYARLADVDGVPAFLGRLDRFAFALEFVEAANLKQSPRHAVGPAVFANLERALAGVHAAGVVHLDCHQKKNVLVTSDGRVYLVDFATALYLGRNVLSRRVLVPLLARADHWGLLKLKARYCRDALTADEVRELRWAEWLGWLWPPSLIRRLIPWRRARRHARERAAQTQSQRDET
jgi:predicted Ser/Thr protein kinase